MERYDSTQIEHMWPRKHTPIQCTPHSNHAAHESSCVPADGRAARPPTDVLCARSRIEKKKPPTIANMQLQNEPPWYVVNTLVRHPKLPCVLACVFAMCLTTLGSKTYTFNSKGGRG